MPHQMKTSDINVKFNEFALPSSAQQDCSVVIPTVKGTPVLKYGEHAYYFLNLKTLRGFKVTISHKDIILPGLKGFLNANYIKHRRFHTLKSLFQKYHYNFTFPEQLMLMTVPHGITDLKDGRFLVNLWSYSGYIDIDCYARTAKYVQLENGHSNQVMGSQQFYDDDSDELYYMTYSLDDSMKRAVDHENKVFCRISKHSLENGDTSEVWSGYFVDNMHDILINKTRQYCVVPGMGMFKDQGGETIPSKVLIFDMKQNKSWTLSRFIVAAHAQFDPEEPDIIYFSNHNFEFKHSSLLKLLTNAIYGINFLGPAAVFKYKLTPEGPEEIGVFTEPDFFRLTNFHVFMHRGQKLVAATGSPNLIYLADADTMKFIKKIEIKHAKSIKNLYRNVPCIIGTISPSADGESLFVQTTRTFQIVDVASGQAETVLDHFYHHTCANHMITSNQTGW
jgi:hypothetical protein